GQAKVLEARVKILDFGLVHTVCEEDAHFTPQHAIVGTPAYMSPEQARGDDIDARSDLFSLGCVLYRLCTGSQPFKGKRGVDPLLAVTSQPPASPRLVNADVPARLSELIERLLAKEPADRPQTAEDVMQALAQVEQAARGKCAAAVASGKPQSAWEVLQ